LHLDSEQLVGKRLAEASAELMPFFSQIEATPLTEDLPEESHVDVRLSQTRDDFHRIFVESQLHGGSTRLQQIVELGTGRDRRILRGDVAELNTGDAYAGGLLSKQAQGGRVLLFQDVTKLIQLEDKLKQHEKLAAVGQLAAGIAHEIRNPLASMSASIEMLRDGDAKQLDGPESHKLMDIAIREIDRLNLLITEFLDFVKPDKMTLEPVDIGAMLEEVLSSVRAGQKDSAQRIEFKTSFPPGTLALASGEKLRQVVWNFLINSIQAISGQGMVEVGCAVSGNHHVRFWVSDSGHGMSEETMAHLFEPFFTTKQRGTGLGLATAYKIVEAHHGEIRVESTKGKGTRFEVLLPRA
jgi:two-component system sensor histidine kinase PilS (NtrC family)